MIFGDRNSINAQTAAEMFWLLFELNAVPMATWSFEGDVLNVNKAFLDMLGYTAEDFKQKKIRWKDLTPKEYLPRDEKCMQELKTHAIAHPYEKEYVCKDGSKIRVRLHNATHDLGKSHKGIVIIQLLD